MTENPLKPGFPDSNLSEKAEKPIASVYPVIDNDLARDNLENDLSASDLQDL